MGLNRSPEPTVLPQLNSNHAYHCTFAPAQAQPSRKRQLKLKPCSTSPRPSSYLSKADLPGSKKDVKLEVKIDKIKSSIMENGVLIVTVPKEEIKKTAIKSTEISG